MRKNELVTQSVVSASDVTKTYGDVAALDGASLNIAEGECVALLGPNGAGKTTMTEILAGFRKATSGEIRVLGKNPAHGGSAWHARIGVVLQSASDLTELKVSEAINHFAGYYPNPRDPDQVIAAVGLDEKRDARISKLSGGQRRRLDVALGIIGDPDMLFLDEPTTGFDPEARRHFWKLIETLKTEGTTILLTTHYLDEAEHLADRVAVIARGKVLACDTPEDLGGRQDGVAHVSWSEAGVERREVTDTPTAFVQELARRLGPSEIPELAIARPSLEDVYLELVGHAELIEA